MTRRTTFAAALALLASASIAVPLAAHASTSASPPVIAVLDSGADARHQEFDYEGAASTTDQFVGWWDFTADRKGSVALPAAGQTWDTAVADPYDDFGHGSLTAASAAGLGTDPRQTPSAYPGAKLAIGKIFDAKGTYGGHLAAAIHWAVDTVHADVISLSVGTVVPFPAQLDGPGSTAISYARSKGVLVVVSNGNGFGDAGVPGDPGWLNAYSSSPDVLAVGASGAGAYEAAIPAGAEASFDPEVVADWNTTGPDFRTTNGYVQETGTSFSAPYVAGFAAALLAAARAAGRALPVDRLETLVKYSAAPLADTPPQLQGYGELSQRVLAAAQAHAAAGTLPTRPSPDLGAIWVESLQHTIKASIPVLP